MATLLETADDVLRRAAWTIRADASARTLLRLLVCVAAFAFMYGAAMGLFRGMTGQSQWALQMLYSAIKAPLLLVGSFAVSLPTFFVLSTLFGLRHDFARAVRALVAAQAGLTITLASLAPLTMLCYASTTNYNQALLFNGAMFAIASIAGQWILRAHFRPLIERNRRHRQLLIAWGIAYVFVAIQLAWLLRPFIGSRGMEVTFLREEAWDNAYVVVARLVWEVLLGG
jgi:hypothetical protein